MLRSCRYLLLPVCVSVWLFLAEEVVKRAEQTLQL